MAAAPPSYGDRRVVMLPTTSHEGPCRICGKTARLTKEHIPPQSVGNKGQYKSFTFQDWLDRPEGQLDLGKGAPGQGGIWGYTLCKPCNELTGQRYSREFRDWNARASALLGDLSAREQDLNPNLYGAAFQFGGGNDRGVAPGDFVRQVLSIMCSLSGSWNLSTRHPEIRAAIVDRACVSLSDRLRIFLGFCWGPRIRVIGPQLLVSGSEWAWIMELAYPPLSLMMVLDANHEVRSSGVDITMFSEVETMQRVVFTVDQPIVVGFTWSTYPWDFRSSAGLGVDSPIPAEE